MKLSEAILLGDTLRARNAIAWLVPGVNGPCGCALGGAALAAGETKQLLYINDITKHWPWLTGQHLNTISYKFMEVCQGWLTIEQLADYVRTIEPEEVTEVVQEQEMVYDRA